MARASSVWVIHAEHGPTHAFTVKHELVSFLHRYPGQQERPVTRLTDGDRWPGPVITWPSGREFLARDGKP